MLLNEQRLRELYAAGEITLDELERGLHIILSRAEKPPTAASRRASAPLTPDERRRQAERIAASSGPVRRPQRTCPTCRSTLREVHENGIDAAWCAGCHAYVGPDPREHVPAPEPSTGSVWIAGMLIEPPLH